MDGIFLAVFFDSVMSLVIWSQGCIKFHSQKLYFLNIIFILGTYQPKSVKIVR